MRLPAPQVAPSERNGGTCFRPRNNNLLKNWFGRNRRQEIGNSGGAMILHFHSKFLLESSPLLITRCWAHGYELSAGSQVREPHVIVFSPREFGFWHPSWLSA